MFFERFKKKKQQNQLVAFASGYVKSIEEAADEVFSSKVMGDGVLIEPVSDVLVSPVDGTIIMIIKNSLHAIAVKDKNGMEIMLHVGIDTVAMNGDGFEALVEVNDSVQKGQPILKFDREKIAQKGCSDQIMMVVTNMDSFERIAFFSQMEAVAGETIIGTY